jgi:hypothetical protein
MPFALSGYGYSTLDQCTPTPMDGNTTWSAPNHPQNPDQYFTGPFGDVVSALVIPLDT